MSGICRSIVLLNKQQQLNYVMTEIGWLDALLSDIRSLIKGGLRFKNTYSFLLGGSCGAGNVSIHMLICTGLELAAAYYTGKTEYNMSKKHKLPVIADKKPKQPRYKATEYVQEFMIEYFPTHTKVISHILWDAIRNGTHHLFTPKCIKYSKNIVKFKFYEERSRRLSYVTRLGDTIQININSIEFYRELKKAFKDYKRDVERDRTFQINFIKASKSIEKPRVIHSGSGMSPEVKYLSKQLRQIGTFNLFK